MTNVGSVQTECGKGSESRCDDSEFANRKAVNKDYCITSCIQRIAYNLLLRMMLPMYVIVSLLLEKYRGNEYYTAETRLQDQKTLAITRRGEIIRESDRSIHDAGIDEITSTKEKQRALGDQKRAQETLPLSNNQSRVATQSVLRETSSIALSTEKKSLSVAVRPLQHF